MPTFTLTPEQKTELEEQLGFQLPSDKLSVFASEMKPSNKVENWGLGVNLPVTVMCPVLEDKIKEIIGQPKPLTVDNCCSPSSCTCNNGC